MSKTNHIEEKKLKQMLSVIHSRAAIDESLRAIALEDTVDKPWHVRLHLIRLAALNFAATGVPERRIRLNALIRIDDDFSASVVSCIVTGRHSGRNVEEIGDTDADPNDCSVVFGVPIHALEDDDHYFFAECAIEDMKYLTARVQEIRPSLVA